MDGTSSLRRWARSGRDEGIAWDDLHPEHQIAIARDPRPAMTGWIRRALGEAYLQDALSRGDDR